MKNYVQPGNVVTLTSPAGGVRSGDGILVGSLFGVAAYDAAAGEEVEVSLVGVYELPKAAGAIGEGAKAYWDGAAKAVTGTASGNKLIGAVIRAAGSADASTRVRLDGTTV